MSWMVMINWENEDMSNSGLEEYSGKLHDNLGDCEKELTYAKSELSEKGYDLYIKEV